MRIKPKYGTKQSIVEMMQKVNGVLLKENVGVLSEEERNIVINDFLKYADKKLGLNGEMPNIVLSNDSEEAKTMKSFGKYTPATNELRVVTINRNLADILRTLAHELVHQKQRNKGILTPNSSETGSAEENEANALAGILLRDFGQKNPIIFE